MGELIKEGSRSVTQFKGRSRRRRTAQAKSEATDNDNVVGLMGMWRAARELGVPSALHAERLQAL